MKIHASCVVIGEAGVLIRGPSGSGKSKLARELLSAAARSGAFARLVSDDRTEIAISNGRLVGRSVSPIEGRIEVRGVGILEHSFEPATVVRLVVDCVSAPEARFPHEFESKAKFGDVRMPRLVHSGEPGYADLVLWQLRDTRRQSDEQFVATPLRLASQCTK
jgi:serine kinase of HPr protein (carbohydrate metabolism regulator)